MPAAKKPAKSKTITQELDVVGLRFQMPRASRRALHDRTAKSKVTSLKLEREPDNPADPNAIKVVLPDKILGGHALGHLRKGTAEILAPKLDAGEIEVASVTLDAVNPKDDYQTGSVTVRFRSKKPLQRRGK